MNPDLHMAGDLKAGGGNVFNIFGEPDIAQAIRTTPKAEIDEDAWDSLKATVSHPFPKPKSGRIAVKVINHLADEVMKVFGV
jgi:adenine-specific DNA-methyltransferase